MVESAFFLRGLVIGFSIAAPVGPIGVLCIRRTLAEGRAIGFVSGLGAATADAAYGSIAALGLSAATTLLVGHQTWLRLIGGAFLCYLGYRIFISRPAENVTGTLDSRLAGAYTSHSAADPHQSLDHLELCGRLRRSRAGNRRGRR